jgi:hypothetical protein
MRSRDASEATVCNPGGGGREEVASAGFPRPRRLIIVRRSAWSPAQASRRHEAGPAPLVMV